MAEQSTCYLYATAVKKLLFQARLAFGVGQGVSHTILSTKEAVVLFLLHPFEGLKPFPVLIPSNFVPKNGFPVM